MSSSAPARDAGPADQETLAVRLRGIGKRFPGVIANDDVNIDVRRGTIHAIVGENGAGKSTLMKILYGVQQPDSGTIEIDGERGHALTRRPTRSRHGVGMVFQHFMLADNLTVLENVVLGAEKLHGIGGRGPRRDRARSPTPTASASSPTALVEDLGVGARQRVEILKVLYRGARDHHPRRAHRGAGARRRSTSCSATCASSRPRASASSSSPTSSTRCSPSPTRSP